MAIDQAAIGTVAARVMEKIESAGYGPDATISEVFVIVTVRDGDKQSVDFDVSEGVPTYVGLGLLDYVREALFKR